MPKKKSEPTFAEARARLDAILGELEADEGDVDQLAARVREAADLLATCRDRLAAARQEVTRVVAEMERMDAPAPEPAPAPSSVSEVPPPEEPPPSQQAAALGPDELPF